MRFIVEVPVYLKVELNAPDAQTALDRASLYGEEARLETIDGTSWGRHLLSVGIAPLAPEEEDREPDVYVCRGGKLTAVDGEGFLDPLDEPC
jgi:hypothetical protein